MGKEIKGKGKGKERGRGTRENGEREYRNEERK